MSGTSTVIYGIYVPSISTFTISPASTVYLFSTSTVTSGFGGTTTRNIVADNSIALPETGQTTSYQTGDDGYYKRGVAWPSSRWEGIDSTGTSTMPTTNPCVRDKLTGLIWQRSVGVSTYNWTNAFLSIHSSLCGWSDWRLPNINELHSLVDFSKPNQATNLNSIGFSGIQAGTYWSSTTNDNFTPYAWIVYMNNGVRTYDGKGNTFFVWPVRSGP